jgi:predicted DNA-binding transcriptional regulator YafY
LPEELIDPEKIVQIVYTNYRGETMVRNIVPKEFKFGVSEWYPVPQYYVVAYDLEKKADRYFVMKNIRAWF